MIEYCHACYSTRTLLSERLFVVAQHTQCEATPWSNSSRIGLAKESGLDSINEFGLITLGIDDMKLDMKLDQVSGLDR